MHFVETTELIVPKMIGSSNIKKFLGNPDVNWKIRECYPEATEVRSGKLKIGLYNATRTCDKLTERRIEATRAGRGNNPIFYPAGFELAVALLGEPDQVSLGSLYREMGRQHNEILVLGGPELIRCIATGSEIIYGYYLFADWLNEDHSGDPYWSGHIIGMTEPSPWPVLVVS